MLARPIVSVCCVIALAGGCAVPGGGPAIPAAGNQFDGTYQGDSRLVRGFGFLCGEPSYPEAITIRDGRFDYSFSDSPATPAPVPVRIAADGSFRGQIQYG